MGDIEDMGVHLEVPPRTLSVAHKVVMPRRRKKGGGGAGAGGEGEEKEEREEASKARVPGTESLWVKTYGCSHNVSDSEYMEGLLAAYGRGRVGVCVYVYRQLEMHRCAPTCIHACTYTHTYICIICEHVI